MDDLFAQYEHELVILRRLCREYAERFPKVAARLQMGGETCDDPHVERLIQSVALLCARVSKRLDDSYPQFTEALLNLLFPHYLRPFPSCAIVRLVRPADATAKGEAKVPRGTILESAPVRDVRCTFQTAYDVVLAPVAIESAKFDALIRAPSTTRLPIGGSSAVSIVLAVPPGMPLAGTENGSVRVYIDGDPSFCAALRDALFIRAARAYVQAGEEHWQAVPNLPITPAGFGEYDALIPFPARSHSAYRILAEYFAFPEKFNFFDIDLAALQALLPKGSASFTLHLALTGVRSDSDQARMLSSLTTQNLVLGCTPVVNLFKQPGVPISYTQQSADYTVLPHSTNAAAFEVYSVDRVHMVQQRTNSLSLTEFRPFYSLKHGESEPQKARYWLLRHDETLAMASPGHEKSITLVNADCEPFAVEKTALSIDLTCSNRDLPCMLNARSGDGDLFFPGAARGEKIRFLRRPTRPSRLPNGHGAHWRLISHLTLNHHSLVQEGPEGLREMLTLYDLAQSPVSQRQIAGIVGLEHTETTAWRKHKRGPSLVHGTEVRLTLDEEAFVGSGLHLFVQVIEQFFALYVQVNSFVELIILSHQSGEELYRCKPRSGSTNLM